MAIKIAPKSQLLKKACIPGKSNDVSYEIKLFVMSLLMRGSCVRILPF